MFFVCVLECVRVRFIQTKLTLRLYERNEVENKDKAQ